MKSKKNSLVIHRDIMVEGMIFCLKTFSIVCVITSCAYFALNHIDSITRIFSL